VVWMSIVKTGPCSKRKLWYKVGADYRGGLPHHVTCT
jgi:hypothetical protein